MKLFTVTLEMRSTWTTVVAAESAEMVRKMWDDQDGFQAQRVLQHVGTTTITNIEEYKETG